jgi:hypothetical protein
MPSVTSSANIHDHNYVNWIPARHKVRKKTKSSYNIAGKVEMSTLSSNRFSPLDNLKVNREDEVITVDNKEKLSISVTTRNATRQNSINKIPTIINGRVNNNDMENPSKSNSYVLNLISLINCDHEAHIIGDSHLKGPRLKLISILILTLWFPVSSDLGPLSSNWYILKKWSV